FLSLPALIIFVTTWITRTSPGSMSPSWQNTSVFLVPLCQLPHWPRLLSALPIGCIWAVRKTSLTTTPLARPPIFVTVIVHSTFRPSSTCFLSACFSITSFGGIDPQDSLPPLLKSPLGVWVTCVAGLSRTWTAIEPPGPAGG